jgi:pimeloyl-ACP methyl ester carboxylesterase
MPFLSVDGLRMYYRLVGQGPPLVLVMGLSGDLTWWGPLVHELEKTFQILLFDNRGAGRTDKPEEKYTIPMFAYDTVRLMDGLGISRAHVFGISLGGMIAQEIALSCPDRVDRLVLGCTHTGGEGFVAPDLEDLEPLTLKRGGPLEEVARQNIEILFGSKYRREHPEVIEAMIQRYLTNPPPRKPFMQQFFAALAHNGYDRLPRIHAPTLIVTGDADRLIPPENAEVLRARIPGSRLVRLRGAGHAFFVEKPEKTATLLKEHLLGNVFG